MSFAYEYPRPAVCVDLVMLAPGDESVKVVLIQRLNPPFKDSWALPGGFVDEMEDLICAARRELTEETGLVVEDLDQLAAYGTPGRDPRGHTVSIVFVGKLDYQVAVSQLCAGDDARSVQFFSSDQLPDLAFDHDVIIADALDFWRQRQS